MADETRKELERLIRSSDLPALKSYVNCLAHGSSIDDEEIEKYALIQKNLLKFNEPSLVLLAIEVYLDPECIYNTDFQLEVIIFLLKCGLTFFAPNGSSVVYIMDLAAKWGVPETRIMKLFIALTEWAKAGLYDQRPPNRNEQSNADDSYYTACYKYLEESWAATKIQNFWRRYRKQ